MASAVQAFSPEAKTLAQGQFICPEHVKATGFPKHPVFWERRRDDLAGRQLLKKVPFSCGPSATGTPSQDGAAR
ncbi:hypothetical protein, partial [Flavonifractor plautii]|uniref:hypothetical protein n=1 Tax=Flavonifractor plautii TaxID=292800 RepID=UPI00232C7FB4